MTTFFFSQEQMEGILADGTVALPERLARPAHGPVADVNLFAFPNERRKWRASPESHVPPEPEP